MTREARAKRRAIPIVMTKRHLQRATCFRARRVSYCRGKPTIPQFRGIVKTNATHRPQLPPPCDGTRTIRGARAIAGNEPDAPAVVPRVPAILAAGDAPVRRPWTMTRRQDRDRESIRHHSSSGEKKRGREGGSRAIANLVVPSRRALRRISEEKNQRNEPGEETRLAGQTDRQTDSRRRPPGTSEILSEEGTCALE